MPLKKQQDWCNLKWQLLVVSLMLGLFPEAIANTSNLIGGSWYNFRMPQFFTDTQGQGLSDACKDQFANIRTKDWNKAFDAFGKPGAGILRGNVFWLGSFDECDHIRDFHYCLVAVNLSGIAPKVKTLQKLPLMYGMCIPENCSEKDIANGFDYLLAITGLNKTLSLSKFHTPLCTKDPHRPFDGNFIATVAFFSLLFLLVAGSSLYHAWHHSSAFRKVSQLDGLSVEPSNSDTSPLLQSSDASVQITPNGPSVYGSNRQDEAEINLESIQRQREGRVSTFKQAFLCFAVPYNLPKLLSGNQSKESIPCIHGIRVISMLWVILGHTFIFASIMGGVNPMKLEEWVKRYGFMVVSNAYFCVDSFFVLSGLLVTYLTLSKMKKKDGRIHWLLFYFHRYWRLTPVLAVTMLFYLYITPYFGHGPYAQIASERPLCPKYWWTNLLYINNFYPVESVNMCIGWVWYLANDMQFFIISPLIIIPLYYFPQLGFFLMGLLCLISVTVTGSLVAVYDFKSDLLSPRPPGPIFADVVYDKPYCRITPYLVGMALGYVLYKYPKKSFRINWIVVLLCWVISCGMGYACVYSVYSNYTGHTWPTSVNVTYEMFCRLVWGIFVAWVIFACYYGYGGWVNSFLAHPAWAPLGRLSYTIYMIHPVMITLFGSHQGSPLHLSLPLMGYYYAGITLISFGCAVIFSLMVEFPLAELEKVFAKRR